MNGYLLDTAVVAAFLQGKPKAFEIVKPLIEKHKLVTSIIVYAEVMEYLKGRSNFIYYRDKLQELFLLEQIKPYQLTYNILELYADLRRQLRIPYGKGLIGDMDTLIAATALENNFTLVTTDHDFERVPQLKI